MDDAGTVRGGERLGELPHERHSVDRCEGPLPMQEIGERLTLGPFECEVVQPVRLTEVVGADHAGVNDAGAVARLAQEALDHDGVAPEPLPQYFERTGATRAVLGAVDLGRPSLAHALEEAVAGNRPAGQVLVGHWGWRETNFQF